MRRIASLGLLVAGLIAPTAAFGQASVAFQQDLNGYTGTLDNEFRAANPVDSQGDKDFISVDEFDGGFQTQGVLRFENLFGNGPNQVPLGKMAGRSPTHPARRRQTGLVRLQANRWVYQAVSVRIDQPLEQTRQGTMFAHLGRCSSMKAAVVSIPVDKWT